MASLPKPEWISLAAALDEADAAFPKDDAAQVAARVFGAIGEGKIKVRGSCRSFTTHRTVVDLGTHIFAPGNQQNFFKDDKNVENIEFTDANGEPHLVSNVAVNRRSLERWVTSGSWDTPPNPADATKKGRGPDKSPRGGSLKNQDAPLVEKMKQLTDAGDASSPWQAAWLVLDAAAGGGTPESKAKRLVQRYSEKFGS